MKIFAVSISGDYLTNVSEFYRVRRQENFCSDLSASLQQDSK